MTEPASTAAAKPRLIDTKVPLVWFFSTGLLICWTAVQLYFTVGQLKETVGELRATIAALSTSNQAVQKELAVLSFRVGNIENQMGFYGPGGPKK